MNMKRIVIKTILTVFGSLCLLCFGCSKNDKNPVNPPGPLYTLIAKVTENRVSGGFADRGKNVELTAGTYTFRLANSTVVYGQGQSISEIVLLRMNIQTNDAYLTLNGIGDTKTVEV
jgi:hypothetical protein